MDKQKQIEEMAKDTMIMIQGFRVDDLIKLAQRLHEQGIFESLENAVVLTREEYNELCCSIGVSREEVDRVVDLVEKDTRKETAEKFAERVKMAFYYEFDELIPSIMADKIDEIVKELTEGK